MRLQVEIKLSEIDWWINPLSYQYCLKFHKHLSWKYITSYALICSNIQRRVKWGKCMNAWIISNTSKSISIHPIFLFLSCSFLNMSRTNKKQKIHRIQWPRLFLDDFVKECCYSFREFFFLFYFIKNWLRKSLSQLNLLLSKKHGVNGV